MEAKNNLPLDWPIYKYRASDIARYSAIRSFGNDVRWGSGFVVVATIAACLTTEQDKCVVVVGVAWSALGARLASKSHTYHSVTLFAWFGFCVGEQPGISFGSEILVLLGKI